MDSVIFLIAQFLAPAAMGLDVVPFLGPIEEYEFTHPIGVFLLRLEESRLVVGLPFRATPARVAADYLEAVKAKLSGGLPVDAGKVLRFDFEKHEYHSWNPADKVDYHASVYKVREEVLKQVEVPDPPAPPSSPTDTVASTPAKGKKA